MARPVIVVGAGVMGLSSAVRLLEAGREVRVITRDLPLQTTSVVAGAIWHPYAVQPMERAMHWGAVALQQFYRLLDVPEAGVSLIPLREVYEYPVERHWATDYLRRVDAIPANDLPPGMASGFVLEMPVVQMPMYLPWLVAQVEQLGGKLEQRTLTSLDELASPEVLVINCSGLGSRDIAGDTSMFPIRGQVAKVAAPTVREGYLSEWGDHKVTYIFPRPDGVILGGVSQRGNENLSVSEADAAEIQQRCAAINPALRDAPVISVSVGLRPGRPAVRLEREQRADGSTVVHNYGHGGAGVTLSWGCADEVAQLALQN
ncbi:MAG TPA: FAD-dependent oxidoreductase [Aggregatilineales bacterium]|nr:FAD-dependent oxidoreductase [Aggregatilineales bacterium]